jgi:antitoxin ParD1/3/4/toxin ParE1/3/4
VSQTYRLTRQAEADVEEITAFIAADNVDAAVKVAMALEDAFALLASQPDVGHKRQDLTDRPLKFWSVYSYLIVYDPASQPLTVITVLQGARDVEQILKDLP